MRHLRLEVIIKKNIAFKWEEILFESHAPRPVFSRLCLKVRSIPSSLFGFSSCAYDFPLVMIRSSSRDGTLFSRDKKDRVRLFVFESLSSVGAIGRIVAKVAKRSIFYSCFPTLFDVYRTAIINNRISGKIG